MLSVCVCVVCVCTCVVASPCVECSFHAHVYTLTVVTDHLIIKCVYSTVHALHATWYITLAVYCTGE